MRLLAVPKRPDLLDRQEGVIAPKLWQVYVSMGSMWCCAPYTVPFAFARLAERRACLRHRGPDVAFDPLTLIPADALVLVHAANVEEDIGLRGVLSVTADSKVALFEKAAEAGTKKWCLPP